MQGGYWKRVGWKHFNGGYQAWGEALDARPQTALPVFDLHHPRGFNEYVYNARGGYSEIGVPMRLLGKRSFELVELEPQKVVGKMEAPPESVVTDADIQSFFEMDENSEKGSYLIGFTTAVIGVDQNVREYHNKPFIQGVLVKPDHTVPEGLLLYTLDSGLYVKVTEDVPNGILGWERWGIVEDVQKRTGYAHDDQRQFIYKQRDYGKSYELYIPVRRD